MPSGRRIEDDARELRVLAAVHELHDLGNGDGLIEAWWRRVQELAELEVRQLGGERAQPHRVHKVVDLLATVAR